MKCNWIILINDMNKLIVSIELIWLIFNFYNLIDEERGIKFRRSQLDT